MSPEALRTLVRIMRDEDEETKERIRAVESILDRGLGKVGEFPEEKPNPMAFFQPLSETEVQLLERAVKVLPENFEPNPNSDGAG